MRHICAGIVLTAATVVCAGLQANKTRSDSTGQAPVIAFIIGLSDNDLGHALVDDSLGVALKRSATPKKSKNNVSLPKSPSLAPPKSKDADETPLSTLSKAKLPHSLTSVHKPGPPNSSQVVAKPPATSSKPKQSLQTTRLKRSKLAKNTLKAHIKDAKPKLLPIHPISSKLPKKVTKVVSITKPQTVHNLALPITKKTAVASKVKPRTRPHSLPRHRLPRTHRVVQKPPPASSKAKAPKSFHNLHKIASPKDKNVVKKQPIKHTETKPSSLPHKATPPKTVVNHRQKLLKSISSKPPPFSRSAEPPKSNKIAVKPSAAQSKMKTSILTKSSNKKLPPAATSMRPSKPPHGTPISKQHINHTKIKPPPRLAKPGKPEKVPNKSIPRKSPPVLQNAGKPKSTNVAVKPSVGSITTPKNGPPEKPRHKVQDNKPSKTPPKMVTPAVPTFSKSLTKTQKPAVPHATVTTKHPTQQGLKPKIAKQAPLIFGNGSPSVNHKKAQKKVRTKKRAKPHQGSKTAKQAPLMYSKVPPSMGPNTSPKKATKINNMKKPVPGKSIPSKPPPVPRNSGKPKSNNITVKPSVGPNATPKNGPPATPRHRVQVNKLSKTPSKTVTPVPTSPKILKKTQKPTVPHTSVITRKPAQQGLKPKTAKQAPLIFSNGPPPVNHNKAPNKVATKNRAKPHQGSKITKQAPLIYSKGPPSVAPNTTPKKATKINNVKKPVPGKSMPRKSPPVTRNAGKPKSTNIEVKPSVGPNATPKKGPPSKPRHTVQVNKPSKTPPKMVTPAVPTLSKSLKKTQNSSVPHATVIAKKHAQQGLKPKSAKQAPLIFNDGPPSINHKTTPKKVTTKNRTKPHQGSESTKQAPLIYSKGPPSVGPNTPPKKATIIKNAKKPLTVKISKPENRGQVKNHLKTAPKEVTPKAKLAKGQKKTQKPVVPHTTVITKKPVYHRPKRKTAKQAPLIFSRGPPSVDHEKSPRKVITKNRAKPRQKFKFTKQAPLIFSKGPPSVGPSTPPKKATIINNVKKPLNTKASKLRGNHGLTNKNKAVPKMVTPMPTLPKRLKKTQKPEVPHATKITRKPAQQAPKPKNEQQAPLIFSKGPPSVDHKKTPKKVATKNRAKPHQGSKISKQAPLIYSKGPPMPTFAGSLTKTQKIAVPHTTVVTRKPARQGPKPKTAKQAPLIFSNGPFSVRHIKTLLRKIIRTPQKNYETQAPLIYSVGPPIVSPPHGFPQLLPSFSIPSLHLTSRAHDIAPPTHYRFHIPFNHLLLPPSSPWMH